MSLTIFGTTLIESVEAERYIGGNGLLSALAAAKFTTAKLISCIGNDINKERMHAYGLDIRDVLQVSGLSFRHLIKYIDLNTIDERAVQMGVYENYMPNNFKRLRAKDYLHFAGSAPDKCLALLQQVGSKPYISVDCHEYHLSKNFHKVEAVLKFADLLFYNQAEKRLLNDKGYGDTFSKLPRLKYAIEKLGENGVIVHEKDRSYHFPNKDLVVTTNNVNAGDVFAGALIGQMAAASSTIIGGSDIQKSLKEVCKLLLKSPYYRRQLEAAANITTEAKI